MIDDCQSEDWLSTWYKWLEEAIGFFHSGTFHLVQQLHRKSLALTGTREVMGFPGGSNSEESACNVGDLGSIPGLGKSLGEGYSNPLQYSCLENPMDRGAWWATVHEVSKSRTWLSAAAQHTWRGRYSWPSISQLPIHGWLTLPMWSLPQIQTANYTISHKGLGHLGILIFAGSWQGKRKGGPRINPTRILGEDCISL